MARLPRFTIPGQPQHVIVRGNNRESIFRAEEDYRFYLDKLQMACEKHQCAVHAYVLMTNHVHLLISPETESGISKLMQMLGRYYVQYFNFTYQRTGTLWEGRYKATLIDTEAYLLTCYRYIELNPIRAKMVEHPSKYPWSSYAYNALGEANDVLTPHTDYQRLGNTVELRQQAYRALFKVAIPETTLDAIREATSKAWILGSNRFKATIEKRLNRPATPRSRGGDRKSEAYREGRRS